MALRLYLPSTGAADVSPAFNTSWDENASADRLKCVRTRISSAMTDKAVAKGTGATRALVRQYVSDPIEAQTIVAGTVKGQIRALESAANDNLDLVPLSIRVVSGDGTTYRTPAIIALGDYAAASEFGTVLTNRRIADGDTTTEVVASDGDRIVIEVGIKNSGTGASVSGTLNFGDDSGTDLGENTTDTSTFNPWVELSQTIPYKVARTAPSAVTGIPDSTTEIDWSWTRGASDNTDVEYQLDGGGWVSLGSATQITLTTSGLTAGTSHILEVRNVWATDTPLSAVATSAAVFTYAIDGWSDNLNAQQPPMKSLFRLTQAVQSGGIQGSIGVSSTNEAAGQKFTAVNTGKLVRARFWMSKTGSPTDGAVCKVYDDNGGIPGTLLATSLPLLGPVINTNQLIYPFEFPVAASLVNGSVYHAVLWRTGALNASNHFSAFGTTSNPYAGGNLVRWTAGAWSNTTGDDLVFYFDIEGDDWYKFEIDREAIKLRAYLSTDGGDNWTEQDASNAPAIYEAVGFFGAAVQRRGVQFYVSIATTTSSLQHLFTFDSSANTWGTPTPSALSILIGANVGGVFSLFHNHREFAGTNKSFSVYQGATQIVSSNPYRRVGYRLGAGGASAGNYITGTGVALDYDLRSLVLDWLDWSYVFYTKSDSTQIQVATIDSTPSNTLTVVGGLSVSAVDQTTKYSLGQGCHFFRDGVNYVAVPYVDGSNVKVLYCEAGTPANTAGNWLSTTAAAVTAESNTSNPGFLVADSEQGGKLFLFFVDGSTGDLKWCHDDGTFTWSEPAVFEGGFDIAGCAGSLSDGTVGMLLRNSSTFELAFKTFDVFF